MTTIGITGGIGGGKSALAAILRQNGFALIDTDDTARELLQPGNPAFRETVDAFGPDILDSTGSINRGLLAGKVFADTEALRRLEGILHPRIRENWQRWLENCRNQGRPVAFVVIPLLYEKSYEGGFDHVVAIGCSDRTQGARLRTRGWSDEMIRSRLSAQLPTAEKLRRATFAIWNEGSLSVLENQARKILEGIGASWPAGPA